MKTVRILFTVLFILVLASCISVEDEKGNVTGNNKKVMLSNKITFDFDWTTVSGEMKSLLLSGYEIDFTIDGTPLTGTIKHGLLNRKIDLQYGETKISGEIKSKIIQEEFNLSIGDSQLTGSKWIVMDSDEYNLSFESRDITGKISNGKNHRQYEFKFGEQYLVGKERNAFTGSRYEFSSDLDNINDVLIFLLIELNKIIDEKMEEPEDESKSSIDFKFVFPIKAL